MLAIRDLRAEVDGKEILKGISLDVAAGEVHAVMGPNGSGKSTLSYVLAGREGYEVTGGSATYDGRDLFGMEVEERAAAGIFLAFQYPVEIPGVSNLTFLKTALNAVRKARGEAELDELDASDRDGLEVRVVPIGSGTGPPDTTLVVLDRAGCADGVPVREDVTIQ